MTLLEIVKRYIREIREPARNELRFFEKQPNLRSAIQNAALCRTCASKKKHDHQRRIPLSVLAEAERRLQDCASSLSAAPDFVALYAAVEHAILPIRGIGELTVYDVAHRIGAYLGKPPSLVYLHAGTRKGASELGLGSGKTIDPQALPAPFKLLSPAEIEDCLCIYAADIRGGSPCGQSQQRLPRGCRPPAMTACRAGKSIGGSGA